MDEMNEDLFLGKQDLVALLESKTKTENKKEKPEKSKK